LNDKKYKTKNSTNFEYYIEGNDLPFEEKGKCYEFYINDFLNAEELASFELGLD
jgi:hypothetical protein